MKASLAGPVPATQPAAKPAAKQPYRVAKPFQIGPRFFEIGDEVDFDPAEAAPYLAAGRLTSIKKMACVWLTSSPIVEGRAYGRGEKCELHPERGLQLLNRGLVLPLESIDDHVDVRSLPRDPKIVTDPEDGAPYIRIRALVAGPIGGRPSMYGSPERSAYVATRGDELSIPEPAAVRGAVHSRCQILGKLSPAGVAYQETIKEVKYFSGDRRLLSYKENIDDSRPRDTKPSKPRPAAIVATSPRASAGSSGAL